MKSDRSRLFFILFLAVLFCNEDIFSQENPTPPDEFLLGGFCASMHNPYQDSILILNYDQILECGLNSIWQKAKWITPFRNIELLNQLKFVYTANDTAPQHAKNPDDIDWISYFTHSKYYRWEAEGDEYFPDNLGSNNIDVGVTHNNAGYETLDGTGWCSGTGNAGVFFVDGPNYSQYKRYTYTNRNLNDNPAIQYKAVFSLKLEEIPENVTDVAEIMVTIYDTTTHQEVTTLADWILPSDSLLTQEYKQFSLSYNYESFIENIQSNNTNPPPPGMDWTPLSGPRESDWFDPSKRVKFKVRALTNDIPISVDYVEVYDAGDFGIWEYYFINNYPLLVNLINTYNQNYDDITSNLYYGTLDEPHSWDSFVPIKIIQHILDSLQTGRNLLVHFCPDWNDRKEGVDVLTRWVDIAQPAKLMFWYAPFSLNENGVEYSTDFTLYQLRNCLSHASYKQPGFFITLQSWGSYNTNLGRYVDYYKPSPEQLNAETMLSLAHGVRGIF